MQNQQGVCSPTVRIIAFQAIDPGSTPGKRISFGSICDAVTFFCLYGGGGSVFEKLKFYLFLLTDCLVLGHSQSE